MTSFLPPLSTATAPHNEIICPELRISGAYFDRRNQPFCGWFLEANLGPRCRFSSFFPNRLPSASQCGKSAPKKFGSGFYLVQITQNGWNSANFPDAGATRSGVGSVAVREECWSSASQRHAAICNRTRGGGRAAGWPPALATHLLMWHSPTESNELSLETSCRLVQICASDSRCESRRRCAHGALDQRLILRPGHLRGVRVAAKCGASGLRLTTPAG